MNILILILLAQSAPGNPEELGIVQVEHQEDVPWWDVEPHMTDPERAMLLPEHRDGTWVDDDSIPDAADNVRRWDRLPLRGSELQVQDMAHRLQTDSPRSLPHYDCTSVEGDCPPARKAEPPPANRPWPDWRDAATFFLPGRVGYRVLTSRDEVFDRFIHEQQLVSGWMAAHAVGRVVQPVLAVNSTSFLINAVQRRFFEVEARYCPSCVEFRPLAQEPARFRDTVQRKIAFMQHEGILPTDIDHDTLLIVRRATTWAQREIPPTISEIVDSLTAAVADACRRKGGSHWTWWSRYIADHTVLGIKAMADQFAGDWLLTPDLLPYGLLIGPAPEPEDPAVVARAQVETIPPWVRFAYAEWDDMSHSWREATDDWIRAGWRAVKRRCPRCESWSDWYCGNGALAWLDVRHGRVRCLDNEQPDKFPLPPNRYLPGDTSVPGQMYTWELRRATTWGEYLENQTPIVDLLDLVPLERLQFLRNIATANQLADRWLGGR